MPLKALNLFDQARGLPQDGIIFTAAAEREQETLRKELEQAIADRDAQIGAAREAGQGD